MVQPALRLIGPGFAPDAKLRSVGEKRIGPGQIGRQRGDTAQGGVGWSSVAKLSFHLGQQRIGASGGVRVGETERKQSAGFFDAASRVAQFGQANPGGSVTSVQS